MSAASEIHVSVSADSAYQARSTPRRDNVSRGHAGDLGEVSLVLSVRAEIGR